MLRGTVRVFGSAFVLAIISSPAYAPPPGPVPIPEPSSLAIFAAGGITVLGVYAIKRWRNRK